MLTEAQAQSAAKILTTEMMSLEPSSVITLFEIDISDIAFDAGIVGIVELAKAETTIFRFHNNVKLFNTAIYWQGKKFIAAPVTAEGFETNGRGTLPVPKLSITVSDSGVSTLATLKDKLIQMGDLVGAKVTRMRTLAKYLDADNFLDRISPAGFSPNPHVEWPKDIFYIDRKSNENKNRIEFELGSPLDIKGVKLPGRLVIAGRCPFSYRGDGCRYEYLIRRVDAVHGKVGTSTLPTLAPAVATENNELISEIIKGINPNAKIVDQGEWNDRQLYEIGHQVYIEKNGIKYYYVAKSYNPPKGPPNIRYWLKDICAKDVPACNLRYSNIGDGSLPYGGFPATNKLNQ